MIQMGIQQIMLAQAMKTEQQASEVLLKVKQSGYDAIELNGFMLRPSGMLVRMLTKFAGMPTGNSGKYDWKSLVAESGLSVTAIHEDLGTIERDSEKVLMEAEAFRTKNIVITGMYRFDYRNEDALLLLTDRLNKAGEKLKTGGVSLLYHNHNVEFLRLNDGRIVYDVIMQNTDPEFINFEFDSYWAQDIGADPAYYMNRLRKRLKLYHINDRGNRSEKVSITPIIKSDCTELGTGTLNLQAYLDIARSVPVEAVILECHKNWIDRSPVKSLQLSGEYLKKELAHES